MITKKETSACVTNDISLEHIYEKSTRGWVHVQFIKWHKPQGCSSPKGRKVKSKDFTSCLCYLWMMNCLYLLYKEIIIYSLVQLISLFWVFSTSLKRKRDNYKGRTVKWKEDVKNNNTYLDSEIFKLINSVVVSILDLFILRILGIRWLL
jgi:hypothetical protein